MNVSKMFEQTCWDEAQIMGEALLNDMCDIRLGMKLYIPNAMARVIYIGLRMVPAHDND